MFVKITKAKDKKYVQLVRSYREDGKVKHKLILNLGRTDIKENLDTLRSIGEKLIKLVGLNIPGATGGTILNYGYLPYKRLWERFGLQKILNSKDISGNIDFSLNDSVFLMGITHLLNPSSKLKAYNCKSRYLGLPDINLHHLYRSLDILANNKEKIEDYLFYRNKDLFNLSLDIVFYDVTTFYFESVKKDSLKDFGFSKDNKLNEVQVVMGLLIDKNGMPVGYELFPGNTFEGKTLEKSLIITECIMKHKHKI